MCIRDSIGTAGGGEQLSIGTNSTESIRIDGSGNVGIGTISPDAKLSIANPIAGSSTLNLRHSTGAVFDFQTGIANVTADALLIKDITNNYDYLTLRDGNVGIGTDAPSYKLHNTGTSRLEGRVTLGGNVNNFIEGLAGSIDFKSVGNFNFIKGANTLLTILETGNVGIGTTSPTDFGSGKLLTIQSESGGDYGGIITKTDSVTGQMWSNENASNLFLGTRSDHPIVITTNNVEKVRVDTNGNVGIGNNAPSQKLQVNGNARIDGDALVEDNIYLMDAGTVRAKIQLNEDDRDNLDIKTVSLGSTMNFFTEDTLALSIDDSQNATFSGNVTADSFIKDGSTSDDVLLGDGTTTSLSGLTITESQISDLSHFSGDYDDLTNKPTAVAEISNHYLRVSLPATHLKGGASEVDFDVVTDTLVTGMSQDELVGTDISFASNKFTVNADGMYTFNVSAEFESLNTQRPCPALSFKVNGVTVDGKSLAYVRQSNISDEATANLTRTLNLTSGDEVEVFAKNQGSNGDPVVTALMFMMEAYSNTMVVTGVEGAGENNVQSDWTQTNASADSFILNKPSIPTVPTTVSSFTNDSGYIIGYTVTSGDVTSHEGDISITESQISDLHTHSNKSILDNFGEDSNQEPTYNGNTIDTTIAQRDVYDGLDSTDNTISLSAKQGKVLKDVQDTQATAIGLNTAKISFDSTSSTKLSGIQAGAEVNPTNVSSFTNDSNYISLSGSSNEGAYVVFDSNGNLEEDGLLAVVGGNLNVDGGLSLTDGITAGDDSTINAELT